MANGNGSDSPWDATYDPVASPGLSQDDPLRDWFSQIKDPGVLATFLHDPERAKDLLAGQGITPPPISAATPPSGFPGPSQDQPSQTLPPAITRGVAPQTGSALPYSDPMGGETGTPPPVFDATGRLQGNLTSSQGQVPQGGPFDRFQPPGGAGPDVAKYAPKLQPPAATAAPPQQTPTGAPVTTPNLAPPGTAKEEGGEDKTPTDTSAKKKELTPEEQKQKKIEDALKHFSDSLKGVQAPKPLAPPQIGAPAVRSPTAIQAPQLSQLLSLTGNVAPPSAAQGLARLLAGGRI